ncbi:MAG: hypothetical protein ACHQHN_19085 [Sphingobacteriales bacterium]
MFHNLRVLTFVYITIAEMGFLTACRSGVNSVKKDDTTVVLQILLDSAFYKNRLAAAAQSNPSDPLTDTIIFMQNDILTRHLPKTLPNRQLTEDEMCKLMVTHQTNHLQFLELDEFIKSPNGYRTALGTHCMWRGSVSGEPDQRTATLCEREKYCNSVLYMNISKIGNTLTGSRFQIMTY